MDWFLYDIDLCRERVKQSTNQLKFIILKFYDRDLQSFITDYNKSLLSHSAECNMENIFRVSQILQLISRAFRRVKQQQNMRNKANICQYCTSQSAITTLLLNACLNQMYQELPYLLIVSGLFNIIQC